MPRFTMPFVAAFDGNGRPMAGAKLYFYEAGTTTPLNTYSDAALSTANANPVVADAAGRWPAIWLATEAYKVVLKTSGDATVWTADDVRVADPELSASETVEGLARVATQAETEAGVNDGIIVTPKKLRWGFSISLSSTGHLQLPSWLGGLLFHWGPVSGTPSGGVVGGFYSIGVPVTFDPPFSAVPFAVLVSADSGTVGTEIGGYASATATGFTAILYNSASVATVGTWLAIGKS